MFNLINSSVGFLEVIQDRVVELTCANQSFGAQVYDQLRHIFNQMKHNFRFFHLVIRILMDPDFSLSTDESIAQLQKKHQQLIINFVEHRGISQNRIYQGDFGLQYSLNFEGSLSKQIENSLISNIASLLTRILNSKLLTFSDIFPTPKLTLELAYLILVAGGGWPVALRVGSCVDLFPRALFLNSDPKSLEQVIFSSSAMVHTLSSGLYGRPCGVWVNHCAGGYVRFSLDRDQQQQRDDNPMTNLVIPRSEKSLLPTTEMVSPRDNHIPLAFSELTQLFDDFPIRSAESLCGLLRSSAITGHDSIEPSKLSKIGDQPALVLTVCMTQMRCLLVQLATLDALEGESKHILARNLAKFLSRDLSHILSIASIDPVATVVDVFKAKMSSTGLNSTGQLDVLSNLLREGDLVFLERISLRIWRHFQPKSSSKNEVTPGPTTLAGEVQIAGNRIRALSHFPSIKILPIHLEKMSGRWFYECTLLSDGLMQIGWADKSFRCDPICGQGVGDHLHSWAIDGLR